MRWVAVGVDSPARPFGSAPATLKDGMTDAQWNLSWVNAEQAWQRLPTQADGTIDWGGFRVAHLDTGYTEHEVFGPWRPNGTNDTIVTRLGRDFFLLVQTVDDWAPGAYCLVFRKPPIETARR